MPHSSKFHDSVGLSQLLLQFASKVVCARLGVVFPTQSQLASELGVSQPMVSSVLSGRKAFGELLFDQYADKLGKTKADLVIELLHISGNNESTEHLVTIDKTEEQEWAEIEANAPTNAEIETVRKYLNETTQKPNTELPTINNTLNNITELRESRTPITELLQHYNNPEIQEAITKEIDKEILKDLKQPPNLIQDIINTYKEYDQQNDHEPKTIDYEALRAILIIKLKNLNTTPNPQRNYINEANQIIQAQQNKIEELEQQAQITLDLATQSSGRSIGGELHFEVAHALQQLNNKIQQLEQQLKETTKERDEYYLKTKPTNTRITELEQELKELNEYYGNLQYRNLYHPFDHID